MVPQPLGTTWIASSAQSLTGLGLTWQCPAPQLASHHASCRVLEMGTWCHLGARTPPGIRHLWVLLPGAAMPIPGEPTQLGITLTKAQINQPEVNLHHELEDPSSGPVP